MRSSGDTQVGARVAILRVAAHWSWRGVAVGATVIRLIRPFRLDAAAATGAPSPRSR
jgi:hypothetical protein